MPGERDVRKPARNDPPQRETSKWQTNEIKQPYNADGKANASENGNLCILENGTRRYVDLDMSGY